MCRIFVGGSHGEFIAIQAADDDSIFPEKSFDGGGIDDRGEIVQHAGARCYPVTFVANDIFDTDHDTKKPARRMALAFFEIKLAGSFFCFFGENLYECIEVGFFPNAGKVVIHYGGASNGPVLNFRMKLCYGTMNVQTGGTFWFFDLQGRK
jgi:hypothetical protein